MCGTSEHASEPALAQSRRTIRRRYCRVQVIKPKPRILGKIVLWRVSLMIIDIDGQRSPKLPKVAFTLRGRCRRPGVRQSGQQQARQNRDDDQQFDKRESWPLRSPCARMNIESGHSLDYWADSNGDKSVPPITAGSDPGVSQAAEKKSPPPLSLCNASM